MNKNINIYIIQCLATFHNVNGNTQGAQALICVSVVYFSVYLF